MTDRVEVLVRSVAGGALQDLGTLDFQLPPGLEAGQPPEARGLSRDGVRLSIGASPAHR